MALVALLLLTSCGMSDNPTPTVTKTVIQEDTSSGNNSSGSSGSTSMSSDDEYIMYIESVRPDMVSLYGTSALIQVGRDTCNFFREGGTLAQLEQVAEATIGTDDTAAIAAAAILAYCPDQRYLIPN